MKDSEVRIERSGVVEVDGGGGDVGVNGEGSGVGGGDDESGRRKHGGEEEEIRRKKG